MGVILREPVGGLPSSVTAYKPDTGCLRLGDTTYEFLTDLAKAGRFSALAILPSSAMMEPGPVAMATAAFCNCCNLASMALLELGGGSGGGGALLFSTLRACSVWPVFQLLPSAMCHDVGRDWAACWTAATFRRAVVMACRRQTVSVWLIETEAG